MRKKKAHRCDAPMMPKRARAVAASLSGGGRKSPGNAPGPVQIQPSPPAPALPDEPVSQSQKPRVGRVVFFTRGPFHRKALQMLRRWKGK
jgi:hypothetical protein